MTPRLSWLRTSRPTTTTHKVPRHAKYWKPCWQALGARRSASCHLGHGRTDCSPQDLGTERPVLAERMAGGVDGYASTPEPAPDLLGADHWRRVGPGGPKPADRDHRNSRHPRGPARGEHEPTGRPGAGDRTG